MRHNNISVFIPHIGCPNMCSFCNQHTISGTQKAPSPEEVHEICRKAYHEISDKSESEIAFFGGSFTAIPHDYMISLLECVQEFIGEDGFKGIRISTRPDCITPEILDILKKYHVTSIELGAQSMSDRVLEANNRGHSVQDIFNASSLIREYGFELGLQIMIGLYQSHFSEECETEEKVIQIHPDTVRIYPVVILKGTKLAELYESGEYIPIKRRAKNKAVINMAASMLWNFEKNNIRVIKCGLHASEFVERDMIGGFYHPAFREICENRIYKFKMQKEICEIIGISSLSCLPFLENKSEFQKEYIFAVNPKCISKAMGHKKSNIEYFQKYGINIKFISDEKISKYEVKICT